MKKITIVILAITLLTGCIDSFEAKAINDCADNGGTVRYTNILVCELTKTK